MKLELFVVPDYVCSGVVEHYFKMSVRVSDDNGICKAVYSAIINKKYNRLQKQAKLDNLNPSRVSTAIFGYDRKSSAIIGLEALARASACFGNDERLWLRSCAENLYYAPYMKQNAFTNDERRELKDFLDNVRKSVRDIQYRNFNVAETETAPAAGVIEEVAESESSPIPQAETPSIPPRASKKVARLVFANGLTEFVNGNIYDIDESSTVSLNGQTYYSVLNESGERRFLNARRVQIEEQFTEPPRNDA